MAIIHLVTQALAATVLLMMVTTWVRFVQVVAGDASLVEYNGVSA